MENQFDRTRILVGSDAIDKLGRSRVAVFGVGGVGGYVCEALVRSGVGAFDLVDMDTVSLTNLNRQIIATHSTIGKLKVDVMKERMLDINPDCDIRTYPCFFLPENADDFPFAEYDYVIDAVDTVTAKLEIIMRCKALGIPVISAMGAGNKLDPSMFRVTDIYRTNVCPLAKVMRRELKKRGVKKLKVVYSEEVPREHVEALEPAGDEETDVSFASAVDGDDSADGKTAAEGKETAAEAVPAYGTKRRSTPGSTAYAPAIAGLMIAAEVMKDLMK